MASTYFFKALPLPAALQSNNFLYVLHAKEGANHNNTYIAFFRLCTDSIRKLGISLLPLILSIPSPSQNVSLHITHNMHSHDSKDIGTAAAMLIFACLHSLTNRKGSSRVQLGGPLQLRRGLFGTRCRRGDGGSRYPIMVFGP